jgi:ribosomal protein S18 acetylase RimI-like enzyme
VRKALDVEVRPLAEDDLPALSAELGRSHAKYFRRRMPLQKAGKGLILVALRKAKPVGAVLVLWDEPAQERKVRVKLPGVPLLYHVWVKESVRGRGVGTQLLAEVHNRLREKGHKQVTLGVDTLNKDAIRLYERLGYDRWEQEDWGLGTSTYYMMVLDLEKNDRTEVVGLATGRHQPAAPAQAKQELVSAINYVLGEVSTTEQVAARAKAGTKVKRRRVQPAARPAPVVVAQPSPSRLDKLTARVRRAWRRPGSDRHRQEACGKRAVLSSGVRRVTGRRPGHDAFPVSTSAGAGIDTGR